MKKFFKLSVYNVLISVLIMNSGLKAQIVYTDIQPDITIVAPDNSWGEYHIDLNNDGLNDYILNHHNMLISWNYQKVEMSSYSAEILCDNTYNHYPLALSANDIINSQSTTWFDPSSNGMMILLNDFGNGGNWVGITDKYLGVRIKIGNLYHYGWIRLDVPANAGSYTVKDYAYNSVGGQEIAAGNSTLNTQEFVNNLTYIALYPNPLDNNNSIYFNRIFNNFNICVYDLKGKLIESAENLKSNFYQLKNKSLQKGIYFIKIKTEQESFYSKMIVN